MQTHQDLNGVKEWEENEAILDDESPRTKVLSEKTTIVMAVPSDNEDDLVREFFSAVRSGKCSTVISLIETNPGLIGSVEDADAGNTALHIAVKACRSGERC